MRFTKMHGIGNDYVYVDCIAQPMPSDPVALAQRISDRHFGVGSDGLILICPSKVADARMRMFNADGSESEMCGNGIRCVAKYVYDHGIAKKPRLTIETGRGVLTLDLEIGDGKVQFVRVDMGEPILEAGLIPVEILGVPADQSVIDFSLEKAIEGTEGERLLGHFRHGYGIRYPGVPAEQLIETEDGGLDLRFTCVSMGNPHLVFYWNKAAKGPWSFWGRMLETLPIFPKRINVHFVEVHSPFEVTMKTWERGSGVTLACGTGASAVCVAGVLTKRTERRVLAHLLGGDLDLEWAADNHVYMKGRATEVFEGEWSEI